MDTFYKYLTVSPVDEQWGFFVVDAGHAVIPPGVDYPIHKHPDSHKMLWEKGRRLHQYHVVYLSQGRGVFETESSGHHDVQEGSVLFLYPGEWHRYRPDASTGWHEHWVGFDGHYAAHLLKNTQFSKHHPHVHIGHNETVVDLYTFILDKIKLQSIGYQQTISGITIQLLGNIAAHQKGQAFAGSDIERVIQKSLTLLQNAVNETLDMTTIAHELNVGYSWFRRMFKQYTGFSPAQYHLELKLKRAKNLLVTTDQSIKEIALGLGFSSNFYFCRIFKLKVGLTATDFRNRSR